MCLFPVSNQQISHVCITFTSWSFSFDLSPNTKQIFLLNIIVFSYETIYWSMVTGLLVNAMPGWFCYQLIAVCKRSKLLTISKGLTRIREWIHLFTCQIQQPVCLHLILSFGKLFRIGYFCQPIWQSVSVLFIAIPQ